jgi:hypothetical protein
LLVVRCSALLFPPFPVFFLHVQQHQFTLSVLLFLKTRPGLCSYGKADATIMLKNPNDSSALKSRQNKSNKTEGKTDQFKTFAKMQKGAEQRGMREMQW